jgi:hypothetical protein
VIPSAAGRFRLDEWRQWVCGMRLAAVPREAPWLSLVLPAAPGKLPQPERFKTLWLLPLSEKTSSSRLNLASGAGKFCRLPLG